MALLSWLHQSCTGCIVVPPPPLRFSYSQPLGTYDPGVVQQGPHLPLPFPQRALIGWIFVSLAPTKGPGAENSSDWSLLQGKEAVETRQKTRLLFQALPFTEGKKMHSPASLISNCKTRVGPCDPRVACRWAEDLTARRRIHGYSWGT